MGGWCLSRCGTVNARKQKSQVELLMILRNSEKICFDRSRPQSFLSGFESSVDMDCSFCLGNALK